MFNEPIVKDWSKVNLKTPEGTRDFVGAVNHFFQKPAHFSRERDAKIQELTVKADFPDIPKQFIPPIFEHREPYDDGWRLLFDLTGRDPDTMNKEGFKIKDVGSGLQFLKVLEGEKAKVYKISGTEATVLYDMYGGAVEWSRKWADDEDWATIANIMANTRWRYYQDMAQAFYDLISASRADSDVSWAGSSGQAQAIRDADTINAAVNEIILDVDSKGIPVNVNSTFVLVAPVALRSRILAAIRNTQAWSVSGAGGTASSGQGSGQVDYNVVPVFSTMLKNQALSAATTSTYFVGLPGAKIQGGIRKDLELMTEDQILSYATTLAGWGRYGGAIGETGQLRRCATS